MQSVVIDGNMSNPLPVSVGVPQGSILGPLLFTIYVNELPKVTDNCQSCMYADDTEVECATKPRDIQTMETTINKGMEKLHSFFEANKLSLNIPKCVFVLLRMQQSLTKCESIDIKIGNESITQSTTFKYLGMQVENILRWHAHTEKLSSTIGSKIGILKRVRHIVPPETLSVLQLYNTIVLPHFDYGDLIYESSTVQNLGRLQKLQNRAARIISGSAPCTHHNDMYNTMKWLLLKNRRLLHKCTLMYKCTHGLAPTYLTEHIDHNDTVQSYNTRTSKDLHAKKPHTAYYSRSFEASGVLEYNALPQYKKQAETLNTFKIRLVKHL